MTYAFAITTPTGVSLAAADEELLPQFVAAAHAKGVKALLSIGSWTGSVYFSDNIATSEKRTAFVKTIVDLAKQYKLDGIDFDWEYPNSIGEGSNHRSPSDTANYLTFFKLLRADPTGKNLILTAAVFTSPFLDATGNPSTDVSGFAILDWVVLMNYDVWGPWSDLVGPVAPLADACAPPGMAHGSATTAVASWEAAGMPKDKIILGVASYGRAWSVKKSDAYSSGITIASDPPFDKAHTPAGDSWDGTPHTGVWFFQGLIRGGWLTTKGVAANGIGYKFGSCSQTGYLYNPKTEVMITFDDTRAFAAKGSFIKAQGLRGFAVWEVAGDYGTVLVDAISAAM
jgi:chitinase